MTQALYAHMNKKRGGIVPREFVLEKAEAISPLKAKPATGTMSLIWGGILKDRRKKNSTSPW
jgi:hypothetical protein